MTSTETTRTRYTTEETVLFGEKVAVVLAIGEWAGITWYEMEVPAEGGRRYCANEDHLRKLWDGIW